MLALHRALMPLPAFLYFFFFNDTATTEIYTLSLHDALPIFLVGFGQSLDHTVLPIGKRIVLSVVSFAVLVVALVESSEEDNVVGLACLGHGVGYKLVGRAVLAKVLPARNAVVRAVGRSEERRVGKECRSRWSP